MSLIFAALSGLAGAAGAVAQGSAARQQAAAQREAALKAEELGLDFVNDQLGRLGQLEKDQKASLGKFEGSFQRTPSPPEFFDAAAELSQKGFDFMTGLKRENLDFILGSTGPALRDAQEDFTDIASGDFSNFAGLLNASMASASAEAFGSPVGTAFNIAAKDQFNFRTAGLNEALKINDFFAAEGTIDPPDPIENTFRIADFEQRENIRHDEFSARLLEAELGVSGGIFDRGFAIGEMGLLAQTNSLEAIANTAGVGSAATANTLSGIAQGLNTVGNAYSSYKNNKQQQQNYQDFLKTFGGRSANMVS